MAYFFLFKTFHFVGLIAWFAGMFYLFRMFVYHVEAMDKAEPDRSILTKQFSIMEWRVYKIILNPAIVLTWTCGCLMIAAYGMDWFKESTWLHVKLVLLLGLSAYHGYAKGLIRRLEKGERPYSSEQFRFMNEIPTLFLLSIVLLAVYKNSLNAIYAFLGIVVFMIFLMIGIRAYKRIREKEAS